MAGTLHVFCGKPGAGKSTLAAQLALQLRAPLLVEDIWMQRLYGPELKSFDDYIRFAPRLRHALAPLITDLLGRGSDLVLDFQANTCSGRAGFRALAEAAGAPLLLHWLETPDALCLQRIARRNSERPEGSHALSEADYWLVAAYFQAPQDGEGLAIQRHGS